MRKWIYSGVFALVGLLAWADAGALHLSELGRSDLADLSVGLPELRRLKKQEVKSIARSAPSVEVLVKFHGLENVRALPVVADDAGQAVELLEARDDVVFAEPNTRLQRQFSSSDPLIGNQWHHGKVGSANAWDWGTGSAGVQIAIVDAPFNMDHPDLAANTAASGYDVVSETPIYSGDDLHASMTAGMAAGRLDNSLGIAGAGNCTLVPVSNAYADLSTDVVMSEAAIRWAADHGIRVVNLSWDGADSPTLNLAAKYLRDTVDGIVVMAGVNGSGYLGYTNQPYIVAVSMTDSSDELQSYYGPHIDLSAPGKLIYSTSDLGYATGSGTSYAAPLVSGMLAMMFSISPSLTADEAIDILKATAVDLGAPGWDQHFGWGRVNFGAAAWLAAATAGVAHLEQPYAEVMEGNLKISTEFHPGIAYTLLGSTNLSEALWLEVPALLQTNGTRIEFTVEPGVEAAFFKAGGELDFQ